MALCRALRRKRRQSWAVASSGGWAVELVGNRGKAAEFLCISDCVAEREGFEPSVQVLTCKSRRVRNLHRINCFGEFQDCAPAAQAPCALQSRPGYELARASNPRRQVERATWEAAGSWSSMLGDAPAVQGNGVRLQTGMAVAFDWIPHSIPRVYRIRVGSHSVDQKADRVPPRPQRESRYGLRITQGVWLWHCWP